MKIGFSIRGAYRGYGIGLKSLFAEKLFRQNRGDGTGSATQEIKFQRSDAIGC
jgi:hypothetical protein